MEREQEARRRGYSARSYRQALSQGLPPCHDGTRRFQQDNARIHTAQQTTEWLQIHGIEYIDWPAHSPDLNPIEHVWNALKSNLMRFAPHLRDLNNNEVNRAELKRCLRAAWQAISDDLIRVTGLASILTTD